MTEGKYIRIWQELELDDIRKHLLIAGDPTGDCSNCKAVGLNIAVSTSCPECKTVFKYIATRLQNNPSQARRLKKKRPDLMAIELSDFKEACARENARNFLDK